MAQAKTSYVRESDGQTMVQYGEHEYCFVAEPLLAFALKADYGLLGRLETEQPNSRRRAVK
jgi:hypothetical protein